MIQICWATQKHVERSSITHASQFCTFRSLKADQVLYSVTYSALHKRINTPSRIWIWWNHHHLEWESHSDPVRVTNMCPPPPWASIWQRNSSKDAIAQKWSTNQHDVTFGFISQMLMFALCPGSIVKEQMCAQQWPEHKLGQRWNLVNEIKHGLCRDGRVADVSDHTSHLCSLQVTQHT